MHSMQAPALSPSTLVKMALICLFKSLRKHIVYFLLYLTYDVLSYICRSPSSLVTALAEGEPAQKAGDKGKQRETDVSVRDYSGSCTEDPAERPTDTSSSSGLTIQHEVSIL